MNAYLRVNKRIWNNLSPCLANTRLISTYGNFLQNLIRLQDTRGQNFGTLFFRNRPQLELIRHLSDEKRKGSTLRIAVLACSKGAEVYSILWTIRSSRPDLKILMQAVDISKEVLEFAENGVYSLTNSEFSNTPVFGRTDEEEMRQMFDIVQDQAIIKSWVKEGITWSLGDAGDPKMLDTLGTQDMVVANNFLCHMDPPDAERCLRNIGRLVDPGGYLVVSGIDLDVRTKVALDLRWTPIPDLIEDIHNGDSYLRADWPWQYWGLEPFNKGRHDWKVRYASVFQLGENP
jgi:SAM-dependent methyltransferase